MLAVAQAAIESRRAAAVAGVAHGEKGKRKYSQHGAYGNDKPQLLAHDAEHGVRIAGKGVF